MGSAAIMAAKVAGCTTVIAGTGGRGVEYAVDTTAVPDVLTQAAEALAIRGTLALVGAAAPGTRVPFEIGESLLKG